MTTVLTARLGSATYPVRVGRGEVRSVAGALTELQAERVAIIADESVWGMLNPSVKKQITDATSTKSSALVVTVPQGEASKSREQWGRLTDALLESGFGRDSVIVALGGGVVGDLAGFVAATFMRGIAVIQVPTTLLAMIDASIGGKVAVDVPQGKNLVGAFLPPSQVIVDPDLLSSLPDDELRAGMAEAVKHGAISDVRHFERIEKRGASRDADWLTALILESLAVKIAVVERDPYEAGERASLNFGHTVGHAVERLLDYRIRHGEAVAIGMVAEARIGERTGVTAAGTSERLIDCLRVVGLPVELPTGHAAAAIAAAARTDKKARSGVVRYSPIREIGVAGLANGEWTAPFDPSSLG